MDVSHSQCDCKYYCDCCSCFVLRGKGFKIVLQDYFFSAKREAKREHRLGSLILFFKIVDLFCDLPYMHCGFARLETSCS